jgi:hypothetical protein
MIIVHFSLGYGLSRRLSCMAFMLKECNALPQVSVDMYKTGMFVFKATTPLADLTRGNIVLTSFLA